MLFTVAAVVSELRGVGKHFNSWLFWSRDSTVVPSPPPCAFPDNLLPKESLSDAFLALTLKPLMGVCCVPGTSLLCKVCYYFFFS